MGTIGATCGWKPNQSVPGLKELKIGGTGALVVGPCLSIKPDMKIVMKVKACWNIGSCEPRNDSDKSPPWVKGQSKV